MNLTVVGLGKLGSVLAAVCASAGHRVTGVDLNAGVIGELNSGKSPFPEPGLQGLIDQLDGRLTASDDVRVASEDAEATLVVVPTPSRQDGGFSNQFLLAALAEIGCALQGSDRFLTD